LNMLTGVGVFDKNGSRETYQHVNVPGIPPDPVLVSDIGIKDDTSTDEDEGRAARDDILVGLDVPISVEKKFFQLNWKEILNEDSYYPGY